MSDISLEDVDAALENAQPNRSEGGEIERREPENEIAEQERKIAALTSIQKIESGIEHIDELVSTPGVNAKRTIATLKMAMLKDTKLQLCTVHSLYELSLIHI